MSEPNRKTAISWVEPDGLILRGYKVEELIGRISWCDAVHLILRGELPDERGSRMLEAILVSIIDHGVSPPSTIAAVTVANTGGSLSASIASGLLAINRHHGGAIEDCMDVLESCVRARERDSISASKAAENAVADYRSRGLRIPGFGHRFHRTDPRTNRLFELAQDLGFDGAYVQQARAMEAVLGATAGKPLPINADGAIGALLCELGFPKSAANGLFMIARLPGLVAHVCEEQARGKPMQTVDPARYEYDGPLPRTIGKRPR